MDEEARLLLSVEANAKKGSGEKAYDDINKETNKKGPVKIPVDITLPIDRTKTKLTQAQKNITDLVDKMTSKGFSAYKKKDVIGLLDSELKKFMNTAKEAGKDNRNPVIKAINQRVKDLQQQYRELQKVEKSTRDYETNANKNNKTTSKEKTAYDNYLDKQKNYSKRAKEIQEKNEKADAKFVKELEQGAGRGKAGTPGANVNLGYRPSSWDDTYNGVTDKKRKKDTNT
jgi:hypothetical protein